MWSIVTKQVTKETTVMSIQLKIDHKLFESYLEDRCKMYPSFISFNTNWFKITNPFQPFICPFPYNGAYRITMDRTMNVKFPQKCIPVFRERYQQAVVKRLFEWLDEEYKSFQEEWLKNAN